MIRQLNERDLHPDCMCLVKHDRLIKPSECFFSCENHAALNRYPESKYDTLLLPLIARDLYSACP